MQYTYVDGQTPLDISEKDDLIPSIINRKDLDIFEQENILEARKWLMRKSIITKQDIFSEKFLLNLHKHMYGYVWKWAGKYRKTNKNIGVDRLVIIPELYQLLSDAKYWYENQTYTINHLAIIFHHRLVKIHLFPNGNGRHARMSADAIIAKYNGTIITWGGNSNLTKPDEIRKNYIMSLREADYGNYEPLLAFANS